MGLYVPAPYHVPLKRLCRLAVDRVEREEIARALAATQWNKAAAARVLGISYKGLLNKIDEHEIRPVAAEESLAGT